MNVSIGGTITVVITLEEDEAIWLKNYIQNNPDLENEDPAHMAIRSDLFNKLRGALND